MFKKWLVIQCIRWHSKFSQWYSSRHFSQSSRQGVEVKLSPRYFFWLENCYRLNWNLAQILSNLKHFKKQKIFSNMTWNFLLTSPYIRVFSRKHSFYLFFVRLQTLVLIFLSFFFCEFQCLSFKSTLDLQQIFNIK